MTQRRNAKCKGLQPQQGGYSMRNTDTTDTQEWGDTPGAKAARQRAREVFGWDPLPRGAPAADNEDEEWGDTPVAKAHRERCAKILGWKRSDPPLFPVDETREEWGDTPAAKATREHCAKILGWKRTAM